MDMPDVGIGISYGAAGLLTGLAATYIKARFAAARKAPEQVALSPDPLRVEIQRTYATKEDLRVLDERIERRIGETLGALRCDISGLRADIKDFNDAAEARTSAAHKRIDAIKDMCLARGKGCK